MPLVQYNWYLYKKREIWTHIHTHTHTHTHTEGRDRAWSDAATSQGSWGHQKLEEARRDLPLGSSEGAWPCQHFDFGRLVSRTMREYISIVLSHPTCATLLEQP